MEVITSPGVLHSDYSIIGIHAGSAVGLLGLLLFINLLRVWVCMSCWHLFLHAVLVYSNLIFEILKLKQLKLRWNHLIDIKFDYSPYQYLRCLFYYIFQDVIRTVASGKRRKRRDLSEYTPSFQEFIYQNAETEEDSSMTEIVKSVMETKF